VGLPDCHLSWIPPAGWSPAADPQNPWMRAQLMRDGLIAASLAVGAWPRNGRTPQQAAEESARGQEQLLASGVEAIQGLPGIPWFQTRIPSGLEQVWWFVEHGEASVVVVCVAHPSVLPSVRPLALPSIASMRFEPAPADLLLDPGFQVAPVRIDESRRVRGQGSPLSLVLPADWIALELTLESEVLAREGLVGSSEAYGSARLHRMPFPGAVQGSLGDHLTILEKNARQSLGLRETLQWGSFEVSGRSAIYLEGRAQWPTAAEPLPIRLLLVLIADGGMCNQLSMFCKEEQLEDLHPVVLEAVRSLRFDESSLGSGVPSTGYVPATGGSLGPARRVCGWCSGQGTALCSTCSGQGRGRCLSCGGTGKRGGDQNQALGSCFGCFGSMYAMCGFCSGTGRRPCTGCGGSGRTH